MATLKFSDGASEFRMEIIGKFAGRCVDDAASQWHCALDDSSRQRRITVDISRLTDYDAAGRRLLSEMHRHGTLIAAGNPQSLVFLSEITGTSRPSRPALVLPIEPSQKRIKYPPNTQAFAAGK